MTSTYELDLDILPLDLHAKIQVYMSVRMAGIERRTDGKTHHVKTITPDTSETYILSTPCVVAPIVVFLHCRAGRSPTFPDPGTPLLGLAGTWVPVKWVEQVL